MSSVLSSGDVDQTAIAHEYGTDLYTHIAIWLPSGKVIGPTEFKLVSFSGQESVSQPFQFQCELHANTDVDHGTVYGFDDIIGRPVSIAINLPGSNSGKQKSDELFQKAIAGSDVEKLSCFNGVAASFSMGVPGVYHLTLQPSLWKLTLTNNYCVHERGSIKDVLTRLLDKHRIAYDVSSLSMSSNPALSRQQDWLQAGESDFDFLNRLLQKAQLYYYFVHTGSKHTVVFANHANYPAVYPSGDVLRYAQTTEDELGLEMEYVVSDYQYQKSLTSSSVNAVFCTPEVSSELDAVAQYARYEARPTAAVKGDLPFHFYRIYPYGGSVKEVEMHAQEQGQMLNTSRSSLSGASHCPRFRACYQFTMTAEGMASNPYPVRPTLDSIPFVLTSVKHQCSLNGTYSNQFEATEATDSALITPFSISNTHQGTVLAKVVAKNGGQVPSDWRYYDKTVFSPNEFNLNDITNDTDTKAFQGVYVVFSTDPEAKAVWVRLAPHMQNSPEVNCIVSVSRSNDEGEVPEIQSIIQNNGTMTVTPSTWTANTHYGNSYSTTFSDSKSCRFPYSKGNELDTAIAKVDGVYSNGSELSGDFTGAGQFKDVGYAVGAGYNYSKAVAGRADILNEGHSIGCTYNKSDGKETKSWTVYDLAWSESTHDNVESYQTIKVKQYSESTVQDSESINHIKGYNKTTQTIDGKTTNISTHNGDEVSTSTYNKSVTSTSTNVGDVTSTSTNNGKVTSHSTHNGDVSSTTIHNSGSAVSSDTTYESTVDSTTVHNGKVTSDTTHNAFVDSSTTHNGSLKNSTVITGTQTTTSSIGISSSSSAVGIDNTNRAIGLSNSNTATGMSVNTSAEGVHVAVGAVGASTTTNVTGATNSNSIVGASVDFSLHASKNGLGITVLDNAVSIILGGTGTNLDLRGLETNVKIDTIETRLPGLNSKIMTGIKSVL